MQKVEVGEKKGEGPSMSLLTILSLTVKHRESRKRSSRQEKSNCMNGALEVGITGYATPHITKHRFNLDTTHACFGC